MRHTPLIKPLASIGLALMLSTTSIITSAAAQTVNVAWSQDATGLDPHKQTAFSSIRFLELMYEPLVRLDKDAEIVPAVAASWAFNDTATQLTIKIVPNAMFHNGAPVTSADVRASYQRILDEETGAASRANFTSITSIETPDDKTVVFQFSDPNVPILTAMASINSAILPAKAIEAGTVGTEVIGSGPFVFGSGTRIQVPV